MSRLRIFDESAPDTPRRTLHGHEEIAAALGEAGIRYERWEATAPLLPGAGTNEVIAAYRSHIDRLMRDGGYRSVDVVSISPDHPDREELRKKFLDEHTHSEDEVRFFVAGSGLFTLHLADGVYEVLCEAGDLIGVPDGTPHWFDMGPEPYFIAIRLFTNASGWVANFTGSDIARQFPRYERG